jgi:hypothetical protein
MARANLVWQDEGHFHVVELRESGTSIIGRSHEAAITLNDQTVSRQHALVRSSGGAITVEHLSQTNPTKVNGADLDRPAVLSDKDRLQIGSVELTFHDLAAADEISGPICSFCGRENKRTDKDCWYCGTSLVNAATVTAKKRLAACRIVPNRGAPLDIHDGESLAINADGALQPHGESGPIGDIVATIALEDHQPVLSPGPHAVALTPSGAPSLEARRLDTGDELELAGVRFLVIKR